jgi:Signal peptidase (SPase) II
MEYKNISNQFSNRTPKTLFWIVLVCSLLIIILVNFGVTKLPLEYILNEKPFGINLPPVFTNIIILFIIFFLYLSGIMRKFNISSGLIVAGAGANFCEKLIFGSVKDYINIRVGYINLADIALWIGLLILNYEFWFKTIEVGENEERKEGTFVDSETNSMRSVFRDKITSLKQEIDDINSIGTTSSNEVKESPLGRLYKSQVLKQSFDQQRLDNVDNRFEDKKNSSPKEESQKKPLNKEDFWGLSKLNDNSVNQSENYIQTNTKNFDNALIPKPVFKIEPKITQKIKIKINNS